MQAVFLIIFTYSCFTFISLSSRKLQEKGVNSVDISLYFRHLFFPFLILSILFFEKEFLGIILDSIVIQLYFVYMICIWPAWYMLNMYLNNATSSISYSSLLKDYLGLFFAFIFGVFLLHDIPNLITIIGSIIVLLALFLRPRNHSENKRSLFNDNRSLFIISLFVFSQLSISLDLTVYRYILEGKDFNFILFIISLSLWISTLGYWGIYLWRKSKISQKEKAALKLEHNTILFIAFIFLLSVYSEGIVYSEVPVYIVSLIGSAMYSIKIYSDILNKRLGWETRTILFSALSLAGVATVLVGLSI